MSIIAKLMGAVDAAQRDESLMRSQLDRMRSRTAAGIDVHGASFAPYKTERKSNQSRPLVNGAGFIDRARVQVRDSFGEPGLSAGIPGKSGVIAAWQNKRRQFFGFSSEDRSQVRSDFVEAIRRKMR